MKKADIRILWNVNENYEIKEIKIVEFRENDFENWPRHLYQIFSKDIGNCLMNWDDWTLEKILFYFGYVRNFENGDVMMSFLNQLAKVDEFSDEMKEHLRYF